LEVYGMRLPKRVLRKKLKIRRKLLEDAKRKANKDVKQKGNNKKETNK